MESAEIESVRKNFLQKFARGVMDVIRQNQDIRNMRCKKQRVLKGKQLSIHEGIKNSEMRT